MVEGWKTNKEGCILYVKCVHKIVDDAQIKLLTRKKLVTAQNYLLKVISKRLDI